ncbi:hypothetical protein J3R83DRAFT_40 [Lanmaoa asiatica]|nr:hypothetical protein J3R83DRAFT_40 [Lanmaoa asiatica]
MAPNSSELLEGLKRFAHTAWNDPNTLQDSLHPQDAEYPWEYRDILQTLQTNPLYKKGAYVIGQPGIGKTYFLVYILIERLREHQPVAFEPFHGRSFYALFTDTVAFHSFDNPMPLRHANHAGDAWALTDSNATVTIPAGVFQRTRTRIIQTTSPRAHRWKEWSKQYGAESSLLALNIDTMSAPATEWGGTSRKEVHTAALRAARSSSTLLPSLEELDIKESGPSLIFFALPKKDDAGHINRRLPPLACVPTPTLVNALAKALQRQNLDTRVAFFQIMEAHPGTRRDGGNIYKKWLHPFFLGGRTIKPHWHVESNSLPATIETTKTALPSTKGALRNTQPPFYWIAPTVNFPGIDSVLVTENEIFAIQVTIAFDHPSPQEGLDKPRDLLPQALKKLEWRMLYVGPEETQITEVSQQWDGKLKIGTKTKRIPVPIGWCVVDPVKISVVYDHYIIDEQQAMEVDEE